MLVGKLELGAAQFRQKFGALILQATQFGLKVGGSSASLQDAIRMSASQKQPPVRAIKWPRNTVCGTPLHSAATASTRSVISFSMSAWRASTLLSHFLTVDRYSFVG